MTDKEFDDFVDDCYQELEDKQKQLFKIYNLGRHEKYFFNQITGTLQFKNREEIALEFIVVPIGSWSSKSNTWMWSWANKSLTGELKAQSIKFKALADFTGFDIFKNEAFEADEAMAHELTSMAVHHANAMGMYIVPSNELRTFLALIKVM